MTNAHSSNQDHCRPRLAQGFTAMTMTSSRIVRSIALIALAFVAHPAAAGWTTLEEAWYAMTLGGQPCGHLRTMLQQDGDLFRTLSESTLSVGRAGAAVTVTISSTFDERADHTPVAASLTQSMGGAPTTTEWTFSPTGIEVKAQQGGRATTSTKPLPPAGWLTPRAADALRKKAFKDGLTTVEFTTIDPQNGTAPMTVKSQRTGTGPLTIDGKQVAGSTWTTRTSLLPIDTVEEYDAAGLMVRQVTPMALGRIEAVLTTKDKALGGGGAAGAPAAAAPELLVASFIQLGASVPDLDCAEIVVWDLRTKDGTPLDLPDAGGQTTSAIERGERVTVRRGGTTPAPTGDALKEFLEPSQLCDTNDARRLHLLRELGVQQADVLVRNSPLSETGVLGFEYGYTLDAPDALVVWEAQFGDFNNVAQVIIDQFIVSSEDKWHRLSGLVLLLPHGFEGGGPEHSSARLERFLALAAEDNIQVVNLTTAAQIFHALRRQVVRPWRKPLVVMSPKSLFRSPNSVSSLDDFTSGSFQRLIGDRETQPKKVRRVLCCSGKLYYELAEHRKAQGREDVAIVRFEQLYPLRESDVKEVLSAYEPGTEIVWVQEEPFNSGAWYFINARLPAMLDGRFGPLRCVSRVESASPATGSEKAHKMEQQQLIEEAFAPARSVRPSTAPRATA